MTNIPENLAETWKLQGKTLHKNMKLYFSLPENFNEMEKMSFYESYTLVTFVRHPFVRLVSAYKDKIIDQSHKNWRKLVKYQESKPYQVCDTILYGHIAVKMVVFLKSHSKIL